MLPWVVLGIILAIGLLISVIYTAVVFFMQGFVVEGSLWIAFGLIAVGKYLLNFDLKIIKCTMTLFFSCLCIYVGCRLQLLHHSTE